MDRLSYMLTLCYVNLYLIFSGGTLVLFVFEGSSSSLPRLTHLKEPSRYNWTHRTIFLPSFNKRPDYRLFLSWDLTFKEKGLNYRKKKKKVTIL